jgi:tubulin--tyrosine ligase-like protein 12
MSSSNGNGNHSTGLRQLDDYTYDAFLTQCGPQLKAAGVPESVWHAVFTKLRHQEMDAGLYFGFAPLDDEDEDGALVLATARDVRAPTAGGIDFGVWLVDHAWTFRASEAATQLKGHEALRRRVATMFFGPRDGSTSSVEDILGLLWKRARHYRIMSSGASSTSSRDEDVWYVADEVGTAILPVVRDEDANVGVAALLFPPLGVAYDVVWPLRDLGQGEVLYYSVTRGYPPTVIASHPRWAKVWAGGDEEAEMDNICHQKYRLQLQVIQERQAGAAMLLRDVAAGVSDDVVHPSARPTLPASVVTVFCDQKALRDHLDADRYKTVEDPQEADIVWLSQPADRGLALMFPKALYVSQFAKEACICNGAQRALAAMTVLGAPNWLPKAFDAANEADLFVGYIKHCELERDAAAKRGQGAEPAGPGAITYDAWGVRPHAAGLSVATTTLDLPLRAGELSPALITEYIRNAKTLGGNKFTVQYFLFVRSYAPLEAYVYKRFWPRFAARPYAEDSNAADILDNAIHRTVLDTLNCEPVTDTSFQERYAEEYGPESWDHATRDTRVALFEMLAAVSRYFGGAMHEGIPANGAAPRAAAMYAVDVVYKRCDGTGFDGNCTVQPMVLSVDFMPDTTRQLLDDPHFARNAFDTMFGTDTSSSVRLVHSLDFAVGDSRAGTMD